MEENAAWGGGATTIGHDATHPPAICLNLRGGGGLRATHYLACIPQGGVCVWGHGGIE